MAFARAHSRQYEMSINKSIRKDLAFLIFEKKAKQTDWPQTLGKKEGTK